MGGHQWDDTGEPRQRHPEHAEQPVPYPVPATRLLLERIARAGTRVVEVLYEFEDSPEDAVVCLQEPVSHLDNLLREAGLRPSSLSEEEMHEESMRWLAKRLKEQGVPLIPELAPYDDE